MTFPDPGHVIAKVIASRTIPGNPRFANSLGIRLKWTSPDDLGKYLGKSGVRFDSLTVHDFDYKEVMFDVTA
jgi:hypothetical protein